MGEEEEKTPDKIIRLVARASLEFEPHLGKFTVKQAIDGDQVEVCLHCGERLYAEETVRLFQQIRNKLKRQALLGFQPLGQSFTVNRNWLNKANIADACTSHC